MTSRLFPVVVLLFSSSLSWAAVEPAEFRFARILSDGMVLQQALFDLPGLEWDRFKGDGAGLVQSKLARIEAILDEFELKEVSRLLERERPELKKKLEAIRRELEAPQK